MGDEGSSTNIVFVCVAQKFASVFNATMEFSEVQALGFLK